MDRVLNQSRFTLRNFRRHLKVLFFVLCLGGCSSEPVRSTERQAHWDPFFPKSAHEKLAVLGHANLSGDETVSSIQNVICDGKKPRFFAKYAFTYSPPDTAGLALDEAAEKKAKDLSKFRQYIKTKFFYESSGEQAQFAYFDDGMQYDVQFKALYVPDSEIMALLIKSYTFKIPLSIIKKLHNKPLYDAVGDLRTDAQYFGYDYETKKFAASKAIDSRDYLWAWVLEHSIQITEAATEDGQVRLQLQLAFDLYCSYGIALTDLISK